MSPRAAASGFVLDASASAAWLLPDERSPAAERAYAALRLGALDAHAPELWLWECSNVVANAVKRKRLRASDLAAMWLLLDTIRTRVGVASAAPNEVRAVLVLAVDEGLSMYDAAYLWLALSMKLPLVTYDRRLVDAAKRRHVPTLHWEDLA